ncbi:uncharacterized protein EV422DRAFT_519822 [Fimicolochytrium jonesii]|uniref:uncharacterized protein n=1 Tax=Fimicolochytrium jonesii TaxID=1396493 RepID=UPI0022FE4AAB|nr:uncharacterized protein EV422DRAFT_519822 [Fimicolochytrium jonesii]KAI8824345.1 hypothetical protein EV422DRAFT_519822 [Fimicolochytrium jonesii]
MSVKVQRPRPTSAKSSTPSTLSLSDLGINEKLQQRSYTNALLERRIEFKEVRSADVMQEQLRKKYKPINAPSTPSSPQTGAISEILRGGTAEVDAPLLHVADGQEGQQSSEDRGRKVLRGGRGDKLSNLASVIAALPVNPREKGNKGPHRKQGKSKGLTTPVSSKREREDGEDEVELAFEKRKRTKSGAEPAGETGESHMASALIEQTSDAASTISKIEVKAPPKPKSMNPFRDYIETGGKPSKAVETPSIRNANLVEVAERRSRPMPASNGGVSTQFGASVEQWEGFDVFQQALQQTRIVDHTKVRIRRTDRYEQEYDAGKTKKVKKEKLAPHEKARFRVPPATPKE